MHSITETQKRLYEKLYHDLGEEILTHMQDPNVYEIMLNPNGELWLDTTHGQVSTGRLNYQQAHSIIANVAGINNLVVSVHCPRLEAELPYYLTLQGERFTAVVPPLVSQPCFNIRKPCQKIYELDDYVQSHRLTLSQKHALQGLIKQRKNILVCGGPGSGKTTLTHSLILEAIQGEPTQRFLVLEDLSELICHAPNCVSMITSETVTLRDLVRVAMRMRPDRIVVGEVRGAEALDLLKAWNTGCPGGICTIHANSAEESIQRLADLSMEAGLNNPPWNLIEKTIDAIVFAKNKNHQKGFIEEILTLTGRKNDVFSCQTLP